MPRLRHEHRLQLIWRHGACVEGPGRTDLPARRGGVADARVGVGRCDDRRAARLAAAAPGSTPRRSRSRVAATARRRRARRSPPGSESCTRSGEAAASARLATSAGPAASVRRSAGGRPPCERSSRAAPSRAGGQRRAPSGCRRGLPARRAGSGRVAHPGCAAAAPLPATAWSARRFSLRLGGRHRLRVPLNRERRRRPPVALCHQRRAGRPRSAGGSPQAPGAAAGAGCGVSPRLAGRTARSRGLTGLPRRPGPRSRRNRDNVCIIVDGGRRPGKRPRRAVRGDDA